MTCKAETVPNTSEQAFEMTFVNNATLLVPEKSLEAYQATAPWSGFGTIKAMAEVSGIRNTVMSGVAFHSADGLIHISGLETGKRVVFYSIDGKLLGAATAADGTTSFAAKPGTLVVARTGRERMKIAVK